MFDQKLPDRRKVGDTIKATLTPQDDKATYSWALAGTTDVTQTSSTYKVPGDAKKGDVITLTVTLGDGKKLTATATVSAGVELPDDQIEGVVTLEDTSGLQSDGTALVGDWLLANIPSTIGSFKDVIFYRDGKQLNSTTTEMSGISVRATRPGLYTASVMTNNGKIYMSDSISVVENEAPAIIKSVTITNDYLTPTLSYTSNDNRAIVTVKLNKAYEGRIQLYKATDKQYVNAASETINTVVDNTSGADGETSETVSLYSDAKVASTPTLGHCWLYVDDVTGEATYKFVANAGLTRGTEYKVIFDQNEIATDAPGNGKENVYEHVIAPYLEAPSAVDVYQVAEGSPVKITFVNAKGEPLSWITGDIAGSTFLSDLKVYNDTDADASDGDQLNDAKANTTTFAKGIGTTAAVGTSKAFYYVSAKTLNGIFAKDGLELTSGTKQNAVISADAISIGQDSTDPYSAKISFTNLRTAGTVYVMRSDGADDSDGSAAKNKVLKQQFDTSAQDPEGSAAVTAGTKEVVIPNVIGKTGTANRDVYIAIFQPDDNMNYSEIWTSAASNAGTGNKALKMEKKLVDVKIATRAAVSPTDDAQNAFTKGDVIYTISGLDQFGDAWNLNAPSAALALECDVAGDAKKPKINWANVTGGVATSTATATAQDVSITLDTPSVKGHRYSLKVDVTDGTTTITKTFTLKSEDPDVFSLSVD